MPRDSQRSKVYQAENQAGCFDNPLDSLKDVADFLDTVVKDQRFLDRYDQYRGYILEAGRRGQQRAYGGRRPIPNSKEWKCFLSLPKQMRTHMIILHELAHGLTHIHHTDVAGHGAEWVQEYLWLVKTFLGLEKASLLARKFRQHGVTRTTKSQIEAARHRLGY